MTLESKESNEKKNVLTIGFSDSEKQVLDILNADRFDITHKSNTKDGLESILDDTIYNALFVKDGAWPGKEGRSAIDGIALLGQMSDIPKLLIEAEGNDMYVGIAQPEHGKTPVVQNLKDLDGFKNVDNITTFDVATDADLRELFDTVVSKITDKKTSVKEDSEKETASPAA